jgi:hypothetical protein
VLIAVNGPNLFWQVVLIVVSVPAMLIVLLLICAPFAALLGMSIEHGPTALKRLWQNRRDIFCATGFVSGFWFVPEFVGRRIPTQLVGFCPLDPTACSWPEGEVVEAALGFLKMCLWTLNAAPFAVAVLIGCGVVGLLAYLVVTVADLVVSSVIRHPSSGIDTTDDV